MACSQFQTIGKTADEMTLKDIVPSGNWLMVEDFVKIFKDDATVKYNAVYVDQATVDEYKSDFPSLSVGWYDPEKDENFEHNLKDESLPLGCTVLAFAASSDAQLTTAGEVVESENGKIEFSWTSDNAGKFMMVGNCTPIDMTLGDFIPAGNWLMVEDFVKIFKDDATVKYNAVYVDQATVDEYKSDFPSLSVGWYDPEKDENFENNLKDEPMPAGCGVLGFAATEGAILTVPSAL